MFKGFTKCSDRIVNHLAALEAKRYGHDEIFPEHVVVALLKDGNGIAHKIIGQIVDPVHLQMMLENYVMKIDRRAASGVRKEFKDIEAFYNLSIKVPLSQRMHECLYAAIDQARFLRVDSLDTFVLFIACCKEKDSALSRAVDELGISFENLHSYYHRFSKYIALYENEVKSAAAGGEDKDAARVVGDALSDSVEDEPRHSIEFGKIGEKSADEKTARAHKRVVKKQPREESDDDLDRYVTDLTEKMFHKKTPLHGRDKEMQQLFRVLLRQSKNNPLLIGDPGVGKTAVVEEAARRICWGEVPLALSHARVLQVDIAAMTAGARFRGDFEERLYKVLGYVKRQSKIAPVIVFIDEFHHLIGAGLSSGTNMDAAGILKPALARGELCCIGATTVEEYQKHIETDKAFARRFMPILVDELSEESTIDALQSIKGAFEKKHFVFFEDDAVREVVRLTKSYMPDRKLPDKAIDMLDEVGSFYNFKKTDAAPELVHLYHSMHGLLEQAEQHMQDFSASGASGGADAAEDAAREQAVENALEVLRANAPQEFAQHEERNKGSAKSSAKAGSNTGAFDEAMPAAQSVLEFTALGESASASASDEEGVSHYEGISRMNEKLHDIITRRTALQNALKVLHSRTRFTVRAQHVRTVMSEITGIPTDRMNLEKSDLIKTLASDLNEHVIGQREAVATLVSAIKRSVVGLRDEKRPVGSFLFLGPTGVGKTHTVRQLAKHLFGSEDAVVRYDMSDFSEQHAVSRLVGAPPGYVGFEDGGLLIKQVRRSPRQILLFDEIEKAHPKIFDIFLQILDEGVLQGHRGEKADFKHCIIVLTSNIGSEGFFSGSMGFDSSQREGRAERARAEAVGLVQKTFRPEFVNRLDEIVCFNALTPAMVEQIVISMLSPLHASLQKQGVHLMVAKSARQLLQSDYFVEKDGARSIRRGIRIVEDALAGALLEDEIRSGDTVVVSASRGAFKVKKSEPEESYARLDSDTEVSISA